MQYDNNEEKNKLIKTEPLSNSPLPDANVDNVTGNCTLMSNDPEQARPDTGEPCDDGRDGV